MSKSKHTEGQIIGALKQVEADRPAEDVAREQGVSKHTIYVGLPARLSVCQRGSRLHRQIHRVQQFHPLRKNKTVQTNGTTSNASGQRLLHRESAADGDVKTP